MEPDGDLWFRTPLMTLDLNSSDLDDILAANDAPPPRRKRSLTEFLLTLDRGGDASGFYLDDFEERDRGHIARRFGLTFLDGSPYAAPTELPVTQPSAPLEHQQPPSLEQRALRAPEREPLSERTSEPGRATMPAPSGPFGGFALPPCRLSTYSNTNASFLDLRIAPASPAAEALIDGLVGRLEIGVERGPG